MFKLYSTAFGFYFQGQSFKTLESAKKFVSKQGWSIRIDRVKNKKRGLPICSWTVSDGWKEITA